MAVKTKTAPVDAGAVQKQGIWGRFFHTCRVAHIPYGTLLIYIALTAIWSLFAVKIPQLNANFFTGDVSVKTVSMFIGAELLSTVLVQVELYFNHIFRYKTNRNLRNALWRKILDVKPAYYDKVSASSLLSRITVDADSLNAFIIDVILGIASSVYMLILTINEMSGISLRASFILLGFVPLFLLINFVAGRLNMRFQNSAKYRLSGLTDYLSELVASLPIVKAFNMQKSEAMRGKKVIDDSYKADRNVIGLDFARGVVSTVVGLLPEVVIITMGIKLLNDHSVDAAGWYTFYIYAGTLLNFASGLGGQWESVKSIQGQLNRISEVLYEPEEGVEPYVRDIVEAGDILFDNVSFSYGEKKALDGVTFSIPKNRATALVGFSGAGKSTALKLLERVYDPSEGRILVGGQELAETSLDAWRARIAYVPQAAPMISGTIRENITYGIRREVTDGEILEAARLVRLEDFIKSCPDGLEHEVGQFGSKLSGGQRQKISVARAILTRADVLILDEPTASLDLLSAQEVAEAVKSLEGKATVVMIAHQPTLVRAAGHVVVMEAGKVTAEGAPEELRDVSPFYTKLMSGEEGAENA